MYNDGDINKGGFRFLRDMICIDICEENYPLDKYLNEITNYINSQKIKKVFICNCLRGRFKESIDISFLEKVCEQIDEIQISAFCTNIDILYKIKPKILQLQNQNYDIKFDLFKEKLEVLNLYNLSRDTIGCNLNESILTCDKLRSLSVSFFKKKDIEIISKMFWLRELGLCNSLEKKVFNDGLFNCKKIKKLFLQKSEFLLDSPLKLRELKEIVVLQERIVSLDFLKYCCNIEKISINYCNKLCDISKIDSCRKLKEVYFETNKSLKKFDCLGNLKMLKKIVVSSCQEIESLDFLRKLKCLDFFSVYNTNILDFDSSFLSDISYVSIDTKKRKYFRKNRI